VPKDSGHFSFGVIADHDGENCRKNGKMPPPRIRPFLLSIAVLILLISLIPFTRIFSANDDDYGTPRLDYSHGLKILPSINSNENSSASPFNANSSSKELKESSTWDRATTSLHTCTLHDETVTIPTVPYFAIIGVQKAGTTSIVRYLGEHPDIMPPLFPKRKEIHFFNNVFQGLKVDHWTFNRHNDTIPEFWCRARKRYAETMFQVQRLRIKISESESTSSTQFISFDKTPSYIHLDNCPEYLKHTCPWMKKIIVILRNPVDRAYSQHQMDSAKKEKGSFEQRIREEIRKAKLAGLHDFPDMPHSLQEVEQLDIPELNRTTEEEYAAFRQLIGYPMLKKGLYALQLRKWLEHFSYPEQILVLKYEDLNADPASVYRQVLEFVGMRNHALQTYEKHLAGSYNPMPENCRRYLEKFFFAYNNQLADLLGEAWRNVWNELPRLAVA
jgi:Sulfotransferase domain